VVFVEEAGIARQVTLEEAANLLVAGVAWEEAVAGDDTARVGVHDEDRPTQGVEQDAVRSLGADAGDGEQLAAEIVEGCAVHSVEAAAIAPVEIGEKGAKAAGLHPERPRGANEPGQPR